MMRDGRKRSGATCLPLLCWSVLFLLLADSFVPAFAGVTLKGYESGEYEYVPFGRYPQAYAGDSEPAGTSGTDWVKVNNPNTSHYPGVTTAYFTIDPIVWRVLSADASGSEPKALVFSEKNLDARRFDADSNNYGTSEVRTFLVSDDTTGFYTDIYFSSVEKGAISADGFPYVGWTGQRHSYDNQPAVFAHGSASDRG